MTARKLLDLSSALVSPSASFSFISCFGTVCAPLYYERHGPGWFEERLLYDLLLRSSLIFAA